MKQWMEIINDVIPQESPDEFKAMLFKNLDKFTGQVLEDACMNYVDPNGLAFTLTEICNAAEEICRQKKTNEEDPIRI